MRRTEIKEVLALVKDKLTRHTQTACGLFWADSLNSQNKKDVVGPNEIYDPPEPRPAYAIEEPTITTYYAVGEED